jgi:hypothetical protein
MQHKWFHWHLRTFEWHNVWSEAIFAIVMAFLVFVAPVSAVSLRFTDRSLLMQSTAPGAVTSYTLSWQYMTPQAVGSVDMLFCMDPIPYMPCDPPANLDVSNAVLSSQSGETGFSILSKTTNHIILTRSPTSLTTSGLSSYTFSNIHNPTNTNEAFSVRLKSLASTDGSGSQIDFGSVRGQVTNAIVIQAQVPPMLIFCLAHTVELGCANTDNTYYSDMGNISDNSTLTAQSQMAVGTNASQGFVITANGTGLAAGTHTINNLATPTASDQGTNQFGLNLVANNEPTVGHDPEGDFTNAVPSPDYDQPNKYKFVSGDVVAYSPNVSLMRKFTVSYIVNANKNLRAGVYTTTINFIASGRF